jgi:2-polyprenyl-3-methyl-5-hydroxy-6-metoxy-1,4-benzoquinol methylase
MELHRFWDEHYRQVFASGASYLDYSNETVQLQSFAAAIDGSGSLQGKACLDVGSGTGLFSRILSVLGAGRVCAVDFIPHAIDALRSSAPQIEGKLANAEEITRDLFAYPFDRAYVIEVLQYVDFNRTLDNLWSLLAPSGRLVGIVPNADNGIIAQVIERFGSNFRPITEAALMDKLASLPDLSVARFKGLSFSSDQSVAAYESAGWKPRITEGESFNRIAFVAIKA